MLALLASANFARLAGPERLPAAMAVHILFLAIPLLEQNPPLFSYVDTTRLLQSLQVGSAFSPKISWSIGSRVLIYSRACRAALPAASNHTRYRTSALRCAINPG